MTLSLFCLANSQAAVTSRTPDRIDGVRLFDEHVLAGLDRRAEIDGVVLRRAGDQHHVAALDHVLVAVQAGKAVGVVHLDLVRLLLLEHVLAGSGCGRGRCRPWPPAGRRGSAFMALTAAPGPRLPQPTRPMRITSLPAAWAPWASDSPPTAAAPAAAASEVFRKSRRFGCREEGSFSG